jgi:putative tryptophan/tyrosine transport system substrate-binding protein
MLETQLMRRDRGSVDGAHQFVSFIGVLLVASLVLPAFAQTALDTGGKVHRVGVLWEGGTAPSLQLSVVSEMARQGYVEGKNVSFEFRWSGGDRELLRRNAADLVRSKVDVLLVTSTRAAVVLREATSTIPIVMSSADPVGAGLVASLGRPGGNVTGTVIPLIELAAKRMQMLRELVPGLARVTVLWNPTALTVKEQMEATVRAASELGITSDLIEIRNQTDLDQAFSSMSGARAQAFIAMQDPLLYTMAGQLAEFAMRHQIPASHPYRVFVDAGGLFSYGVTAESIMERTVSYVGQILRGAQPQDLPVTRSERFDLFINAKAVRALGITVPKALLMRASEVIQ